MIDNQLIRYLDNNHISYQLNCSLKAYNTLHIGGLCDVLVEPENVEEIRAIIEFCQLLNINYVILGKGSNVLFSDDGFNGVVICLATRFNKITLINNHVIAQSGVLLKDVADVCKEHSLSGFEFACGIPGTIGGACIMNAGAYDGEMKDVIYKVLYLNENNQIIESLNNQLKFAYRYCSLQDAKNIVLQVELQLVYGQKALIEEKMHELTIRRLNSQPLEYYSAGSTFKRPQGSYASYLIKQSNLMGYRQGGCSVSNKHSGFLINDQSGSANDFMNLIEDVQNKVYHDSGYLLELEVKIVK